MFDDFEEELNCFSKKTSGCFIKNARSLLKKEIKQDEEIKNVEEMKEIKQDEEEEEELHFKIKKRSKISNVSERQDEETIKQLKKNGLMCNCGSATVLREVKKDGANKGRMFYACPNSYDNKCDYFMWKDESDNKINKQSIRIDENKTEYETKTNTDEPIQLTDREIKQQQKVGLMCYCKLPSVSREVKKDGPNKGKMFYTCSKYDNKCKYFVWK